MKGEIVLVPALSELLGVDSCGFVWVRERRSTNIAIWRSEYAAYSLVYLFKDLRLCTKGCRIWIGRGTRNVHMMAADTESETWGRKACATE